MKPQFTDITSADSEYLVDLYGHLFSKKLKAEVEISFEKKNGRDDVEIKYDFYNIKPL